MRDTRKQPIRVVQIGREKCQGREAAIAAWNAGIDFVVCDKGDSYDGLSINRHVYPDGEVHLRKNRWTTKIHCVLQKAKKPVDID